MGKKIIFHSSHCPKCKVLEMKLQKKGIQYEENNDIDVMIAKGLTMAPALEVDGKMLDFVAANEWINKYGE